MACESIPFRIRNTSIIERFNKAKSPNIATSLNELENSFATKDYRYFLKQDEFLTITKDGKKEIIKVDKYSFKNEKINVFKYEK